jgi:hypothetical protein
MSHLPLLYNIPLLAGRLPPDCNGMEFLLLPLTFYKSRVMLLVECLEVTVDA